MKGGQIFALATGVIFLLIGIMGFIPSLVTPPEMIPGYVAANGTEVGYGYLMGLFPINVLHNFVHIAIGGFGIFSAIALDSSRYYARFVAVFYGLLAVLGFIPIANIMFGLVPIYGNDVWLHALTAGIAAYFGFVAQPGIQQAYASSEDRANREATQSR
ncbi:DUF4383 domain-containing protein [Leptolyngbya sp. AN02str]|uniref:DUF4383 domain-containing protein n=1 Tax=Leptolyngbya sp. AN02str TaxID=3423363 RepID=UPI003D322E1E